MEDVFSIFHFLPDEWSRFFQYCEACWQYISAVGICWGKLFGMVNNIRLSSTNPMTLVNHIFVLLGFDVVNSVIVYLITFIIGIKMNAHLVPLGPYSLTYIIYWWIFVWIVFFDTSKDVFIYYLGSLSVLALNLHTFCGSPSRCLLMNTLFAIILL